MNLGFSSFLCRGELADGRRQVHARGAEGGLDEEVQVDEGMAMGAEEGAFRQPADDLP